MPMHEDQAKAETVDREWTRGERVMPEDISEGVPRALARLEQEAEQLDVLLRELRESLGSVLLRDPVADGMVRPSRQEFSAVSERIDNVADRLSSLSGYVAAVRSAVDL